MATQEEENKLLKEANNELAQKVQYWKMTAAQRENEKLNLMKEINDLRLKLSRLRRTTNNQAQSLETALQSASEKALAHLVRASSEIARTMDIAKTYMRDRQALEASSPRWSSISGTPSEKKGNVHRVPPLMMGGQSIQPVVALSRTVLNASQRSAASPNQNRNITARAVPMHMLQDVYIPLTRVDADQQQQAMETEENNDDDSADELGLDDSEEREMEDSQIMQDTNDYNASRILNVVTEDPEDEETTPQRNRSENPLEGPSWMLDSTTTENQTKTTKSLNLEPDSTTELEEGCTASPIIGNKRTVAHNIQSTLHPSVSGAEFTPTVRRRKRAASPPHEPSPRPAARRNSTSTRVLKVLVAKMQLDSSMLSPPSKRALPASADTRFDAPSPNGATVSGVIVSEDVQSRVVMEPVQVSQAMERTVKTERASHDRTTPGHDDTRADMSRGCSSDSDSGSGAERPGGRTGRTRRPRKIVTYKEKPLNRKLRR